MASIPQFIETLPNGVEFRILEAMGSRAQLDNTEEFLIPEGFYFMMEYGTTRSTVGIVPSVWCRLIILSDVLRSCFSPPMEQRGGTKSGSGLSLQDSAGYSKLLVTERWKVTWRNLRSSLDILGHTMFCAVLSPMPVPSPVPGMPMRGWSFLARVLALIMAEHLLDRFPHEREGAIAKRHVGLVRREALAEIARQIDLGRFLIISQETEAGVRQAGRSFPMPWKR